MNNDMETKEVKTYKCQICNKEAKDAVDEISHLLDHGSTALARVTAMIQEQRSGSVSTADRARVSASESKATQRERGVIAAQE
jgi:hypothetical protein